MVFIIIAVVLLQYGFAVYCLLKLAYMDLSRNMYILWNLFILIVFFIGGAVFLVYYFKHPNLRISKDAPLPEGGDSTVDQTQSESAEQAEQNTDTDQAAEKDNAQEAADNTENE
ncbi:MAG: hypothetical protein J1F69_05410 [Clostridiales bacterium]|nr:hypothetical protein [Clostridiales bacterium]